MPVFPAGRNTAAGVRCDSGGAVKQGPNEKRLIAHKASVDMVPPGGGVADVVGVLTQPGKLNAVMRAAAEWVATALDAMRTAPDPNPWRDADNEAIAEELLKAIERRKAGQRAASPAGHER